MKHLQITENQTAMTEKKNLSNIFPFPQTTLNASKLLLLRRRRFPLPSKWSSFYTAALE